MKPFSVVAAHGLTTRTGSGPTHACRSAFGQWVDFCHASGLAFESLKPDAFASNRNAVFLTCDDALSSVLEMADLIKGSATLFVVTDYVGKYNQWPGQPSWVPMEKCLDWSEIRALAARGWTIAAHSSSHVSFHQLSPLQINHELRRSVHTIEDQLGQACRFFAYPYGHETHEARAIVGQLGLIAFGTEPGWIQPNSDLTRLPRLDLYDILRSSHHYAWPWQEPCRTQMQWLRMKRYFGGLRKLRCAS